MPTSHQKAIAAIQSATALISTATGTGSSGSSTGSNNVVGLQLPTITSRSSSLHQSGYGCALMSPQTSTTLAECVCAAVFHGFVSGSMDIVQTAAEG